MKKVYITALLISSLSISAFAFDGGKKDKAKAENKISNVVLSQFSYEFKDAKNITWIVDANCQKAMFDYEGKTMTAFYTLTGEYLGVTHTIAFEQIPASAQKEILAGYRDYKVGDVIEFQPAVTNSASLYSFSSYSSDEKVYFVDLKNDKEEFILRVTPDASVYFFKQVK